MNRRNGVWRVGVQRRDLALEDLAAAVILVAKINVDGIDADRPGCDQSAFEKTVRIALEVITILERPRLALIDVDRQQPRSRFCRYQFPFAAGRETGAAEAAQARVFHNRDDLGLGLLPSNARCSERVATGRTVVGVRNVAGSDEAARRMCHATAVDGGRYLGEGGVRDRTTADDGARRGAAPGD